MISRAQPRYADLDLDFSPNPITKDISMKQDVEAVKRAVRNLIFTNKYEKLFQPEVEAGIDRLLFENFGSVRLVTLRNRLEQAIVNFEPRITEVEVFVQEIPDKHSILIEIVFRVRNIPQLESLQIELNRVR